MTPNLIGKYNDKPVYYDESYVGRVATCRGPVKEVNLPGIVYMNYETGKMTKKDGTPYIPEHVDYEEKFYIVGTEDLNEAREHIELYKKDRNEKTLQRASYKKKQE